MSNSESAHGRKVDYHCHAQKVREVGGDSGTNISEDDHDCDKVKIVQR